ncbi:putative metal-dependent hydrolase YcfH [Commensalibacter sp. Nvir]|uniref:TatD family hydrolase n=1 Tax=Commensalibacter sp. Nvir TaxID=3069817 RepID=UPI002D3FDA69|nr:putative metal-dependent hydrolase YcfH [Commensalibacter sp. Nvir]
MYLVDTHCHLDFFPSDQRVDLFRRCKESNVGELVTIGTRLSQASVQINLTQLSSPTLKIWCTIGTHPGHVEEEIAETTDAIASFTQHPMVIGIGETGLDYYYGEVEYFEKQRQSFKRHIQASQITQLPLCIHARNADEDLIHIISEEYGKGGPFPFVIHCFSSSLELAQFALKMGGYISISGIVTFKNAGDLRSIIKELPLDRLLIETDSPYLAPVPKRGKQNEPAFVAYTAQFLAKLFQIKLEELTHTTTRNFYKLFSKASAT